MSDKLPNVVFIVASGKKHGIGHLKRCVAIAESGKSSFNSYFNFVGEMDYENIKDILKFPVIVGNIIENTGMVESGIDIFVTDCRNTSKKFMKELIRIAPVISIDDLGRGAIYAVSRILSIPALKKVNANYNGLKYLVLDPSIKEYKRKKEKNENIGKGGILISFGGSDPNNLTREIAEILIRNGFKPKIIKGHLYDDSLENLNANVVKNPVSIFKLIAEADLVITSFGMTMFEAFYLGTPVILYNHSKYHYKLSLKYDIPNLAYPGYFRKSDLEKILIESINDRNRLLTSIERYSNILDTGATERIVRIIRGVIDNGRTDCIFHHRDYKVVFRRENYSISKCLKCGDLFLTRMTDSKEKYKKDYFLNEYEKQYGKSYENDRDNIIRTGNTRLDRIEHLKPERGKILDIGCALGFFVELALNRGWDSEGIEVSEYASNWARDKLGVKVITGNFMEHDFKNEYYDAVTMFFVLEHFGNVEDVIAKVYKILKKGGVLALALPNRGGISYRLSRKKFLNNHPDDHFFDTTFRNISKFLSLNGFQVRDVRITGIHPERFFSKFGVKRPAGWLNRFYRSIANVIRLGDTFEVYAVKE